MPTLSDVVRGAVSLLAPLAREEQVQLTAEMVPTAIVCDPAQLTQVVTNLITNGIRYNPPAEK